MNKHQIRRWREREINENRYRGAAHERDYTPSSLRPLPMRGPAIVVPSGKLHWPDCCRMSSRRGRMAETREQVTCADCLRVISRWR